jgi:hypothetical protein
VKGAKLLYLGLPLVITALDSAQGQQRDSVNSASKAATISGIVKDEYADPLARAEVVVQPGNYSATTDESGKFRIQAPAGDYNVVFRHLGYGPEDFSWRARAGEGTELSIKLNPVPQALDTVVILDLHNRAAGASTISGVTINKNGNSLAGVEIQLLGTGRHATSYEHGEFFFAGLAPGDYVVRARRMGYEPTAVPIKIGKRDEHDLSIILSPLPNTLATVEIREKSGFGRSAEAWEEFDRRRRWKSTNNYMVDRNELARSGKAPLDAAIHGTQAQGLLELPAGGYGPVSIHPRNSSRAPALTPILNDVCILINGTDATRLPLSAFHADQVARLEVYAANSDLTMTIGRHMDRLPECRQEGFKHPPYFVIWMRGTS